MPLARRIAEAASRCKCSKDLPPWVMEAVFSLLHEKPLTRAEILILVMARTERVTFEDLIRNREKCPGGPVERTQETAAAISAGRTPTGGA